MTEFNTKRHTNNTQSNAQMHQGFVDDPIAESYDRHGRYCQKETFIYRSNSYLGSGKTQPREDLDLFNRSKSKTKAMKRRAMMNRVTNPNYAKV